MYYWQICSPIQWVALSFSRWVSFVPTFTSEPAPGATQAGTPDTPPQPRGRAAWSCPPQHWWPGPDSFCPCLHPELPLVSPTDPNGPRGRIHYRVERIQGTPIRVDQGESEASLGGFRFLVKPSAG